ncbi:MAG: cyclophilin-like fold protein [Nitrospirota bacterium]
MSTPIIISIGELKLSAELNDSPSANMFRSLLPLEFNMSRWGDEYYGDCGINVELSRDAARDVMEVGEMALWPTGRALCIFFGPTPVSKGKEPRAVSPVNPIGRLIDSPEPLKNLGSSIHVRIEVLK